MITTTRHGRKVSVRTGTDEIEVLKQAIERLTPTERAVFEEIVAENDGNVDSLVSQLLVDVRATLGS